MDLSDLTVRILLLFFPGVLCAMFVDSLTTHRERTAPVFALHAIVLGVTTYATLHGVAVSLNWLSGFFREAPWALGVTFFRNVSADAETGLVWGEILLAAVWSVPLALALTKVLESKYLHRVAHGLGVTRKFGDLDVWSLMFNSDDVEWVVVRDLSYDLSYLGWVKAFSETAEEAQLLLHDVVVSRNSTGDHLYEVGGLFVARDRNEMLIELADFGYGS